MILYITIQALLWSVLTFYIIATSIEIARCNPREKAWNPPMEGRCLNTNAIYMATGVLNIVFDFAILIFPMVPLWRLQMPLKKKAMTTAIFAVGVT